MRHHTLDDPETPRRLRNTLVDFGFGLFAELLFEMLNVESAQTTQMSFSKSWAGLPEAEAATWRASSCSLALR
jgi:hypothetical protein